MNNKQKTGSANKWRALVSRYVTYIGCFSDAKSLLFLYPPTGIWRRKRITEWIYIQTFTIFLIRFFFVLLSRLVLRRRRRRRGFSALVDGSECRDQTKLTFFFPFCPVVRSTKMDLYVGYVEGEVFADFFYHNQSPSMAARDWRNRTSTRDTFRRCRLKCLFQIDALIKINSS